LDRKEELILAKQLRACRVQILPKLRTSHSVSPVSSSPSPIYPNSLQVSKEPSPMTPNSPRTSHHQAPPSPRMPHGQAQAQVCDVMNELQMKMQRASALREQTKQKTSLPQDQSQQQVPQQKSQMLQEQSKQQIASMLQEKALQQKEQFLREQLMQHQQRASMLPDESQGASLARVHSSDQSIQQSPSVQQHNSVQNPGLIPTSPKIVISQPGNPATGKNTTDLENMFTVKKLPFLNDINRLRQPEVHSSVSTLTAPTHNDSDRDINLEAKDINPHLGYLENRPKMTEFPFLDDIRRLRKDTLVQAGQSTRQTNSISTDQTSEPSKSGDIDVDRLNTAAKEQSNNELLKFNNEKKVESMRLDRPQSPTAVKTVRFTADNPGKSAEFSEPAVSRESAAFYNETEDIKHKENSFTAASYVNDNARDNDEGEYKTPRTPKTKRASKFNLKIDEKTNVKRLADQMIPQLNVMQKNFLGLLFFNELSQNIVDDIVAQQLSMMPGSKVASVISSLDPQASYTALNMMLNSLNDEARLALLCENFAYLNSEERAGILFTTSDDVAEVCTTIADFGGKSFKKALIARMLENEDTHFLDDVIVEHQHGSRLKAPRRPQDDVRHLSSADDTYNSAEESLADVMDDDVYQYEYFDFSSK